MPKIHAFLKRWLFLGCFVLWIFLMNLQLSNLGSFLRIPTYRLYKLAEYAVPALLLAQIVFFQSHSRRQLAVLIPLTALFAVSAWRAGPWDLIILWLFLVAARDQDPDELVRAGYCTLLLAFLFVISSFFLGRVAETTALRKPSVIPRHSWGYVNPNVLGIVFLQLTACRLYLHRKNLKPEDFIFVAGALALAYAVPNSLASVVGIALLLVLAIVCLIWPKLPEKLRKALLICLIAGAVFCNLFSVAVSLAYRSGGFLEKLDSLFTIRFSSANQVFSVYGLSVFGRRLAPMQSQAEYNGLSFWMPPLDSAYMNLLLRYGLLAYLAYSAVYLGGMLRVRKNGNVMLLGILAIFAVHAIMEPSLYDLRCSFFPIVMFAALPAPEKSEIASHNFIRT